MGQSPEQVTGMGSPSPTFLSPPHNVCLSNFRIITVSVFDFLSIIELILVHINTVLVILLWTILGMI